MEDNLLNDYMEEAEDILSRVSSLLERLEKQTPTKDDIDSLFRDIHTIKGGASMFGMDVLTKTAHTLETFLAECQKDSNKFDLAYVQEAVDAIDSQLHGEEAELSEKTSVSTMDVTTKIVSFRKTSQWFEDFLNTFGDVIDDQLAKGGKLFECSVKKLEDFPKFLSLLEKNKFDKLAEVVIDGEHVALLLLVLPDDVVMAENAVKELQHLHSFTELSLIAEVPKLAADIEAESTQSAQSKQTPKEVLRVPVDKVNQVLNSIWEIFLLRNQMAYLIEQNKPSLRGHMDMIQNWEILDNSLRRNISDLESTAMSLRMTDFSSVFSRMKKVIRGYTKETGKKINFETKGEDIELDKKVIDLLGEPLIHLIRNAMDHGVEDEATRLQMGKPEFGTIRLEAEALSEKVILTISDDGKGIDGGKILAKAKEKGLDTSSISAPADAVNLIFEPGFSTAEQVTSVSGRGVGMDAVQKSIIALGGEIQLKTEVGKGSSFVIELPLSMSVISCIVYKVNSQTFASSINNLVEICRENADVLVENNGEQLFSYRGSFIPCFDLRDLIDSTAKQKEERVTLCVVNFGGELVALRVSHVQSHTELVVKELAGVFPKLEAVSGVSILATGEPIFVLSIPKVFRLVKDFSPKITLGVADAAA